MNESQDRKGKSLGRPKKAIATPPDMCDARRLLQHDGMRHEEVVSRPLAVTTRCSGTGTRSSIVLVVLPQTVQCTESRHFPKRPSGKPTDSSRVSSSTSSLSPCRVPHYRNREPPRIAVTPLCHLQYRSCNFPADCASKTTYFTHNVAPRTQVAGTNQFVLPSSCSSSIASQALACTQTSEQRLPS